VQWELTDRQVGRRTYRETNRETEREGQTWRSLCSLLPILRRRTQIVVKSCLCSFFNNPLINLRMLRATKAMSLSEQVLTVSGQLTNSPAVLLLEGSNKLIANCDGLVWTATCWLQPKRPASLALSCGAKQWLPHKLTVAEKRYVTKYWQALHHDNQLWRSCNQIHIQGKVGGNESHRMLEFHVIVPAEPNF
jgi:hypothetical protein